MELTAEIRTVLDFLGSRTPRAWIDAALADPDTLLLDHASLELKAAQQAQKLIWKYASVPVRQGRALDAGFRSRLLNRMSRLAREELRHFEQVAAMIEKRGSVFLAIEPSRYAAGLHALARGQEPGALIDALIIGAVIEARSCERFFSLCEPLRSVDPELAAFYGSLLRSEARHFGDYLQLARQVDAAQLDQRLKDFLQRDAELIITDDTVLRFHSGPPRATTPLQ